jgi:hypothetical protein
MCVVFRPKHSRCLKASNTVHHGPPLTPYYSGAWMARLRVKVCWKSWLTSFFLWKQTPTTFNNSTFAMLGKIAFVMSHVASALPSKAVAEKFHICNHRIPERTTCIIRHEYTHTQHMRMLWNAYILILNVMHRIHIPSTFNPEARKVSHCMFSENDRLTT